MSLSSVTTRTIRGLTYVTVAILLVALGSAGPVQAAPSKSPPAKLPAVGEEYDLEANSAGLRFAVDDETMTSDPARGTLSMTVAADPSDPKRSVDARPSGLRLTTKAAQTHTLTVEQDEAAAAERSRLKLVRPDPVKYEHVMVLNLTFDITLESATGPERSYTLTTDEPARLRASLTAFPPKNDTYTLVAPVALRSATPIEAERVSLTGFDVVVNRA